MSAREHVYQIIVRCSGHEQVPRSRILRRDTEAAGVDAAIRELRRTRNTANHGTDFDCWDLYDYDNGRAKRKLLRSGNVYGPSGQDASHGTDHRGAVPNPGPYSGG